MDVFDPATSPSLARLSSMVGLAKVKAHLQAFVQRCLESHKSKTPLPPLHLAFMGSPGTGRATVAYLYGDLLKELGLLSEGGITSVSASGLLGEAVGEAARLTLAALSSAKGKVLYVDDAHLLDRSLGDGIGRNVLDVLAEGLGAASESGKGVVVILSGPKELASILLDHGNPNLTTLFEAMHFDDLTDAELERILVDRCCERALAIEAHTVARVVQALASERAGGAFGNGRSVANFVDRAMRQREERMRKQAASLFLEDFFPPPAGSQD